MLPSTFFSVIICTLSDTGHPRKTYSPPLERQDPHSIPQNPTDLIIVISQQPPLAMVMMGRFLAACPICSPSDSWGLPPPPHHLPFPQFFDN